MHDGTDQRSIEPDESVESEQASDSVETSPEYPDAVVLQFPIDTPKGSIKPYFLMGDSRRPVNLWTWTSSDSARALSWKAKGMDEIVPQPDSLSLQSLQARGVYEKARYRIVIKRRLTTENIGKEIQFEEGRFIPVAFHAWDGSNEETGKMHAVSSWYLLYLEPPRPLRSFLLPPLFAMLAAVTEFWFVRRIRRAKKQ